MVALALQVAGARNTPCKLLAVWRFNVRPYATMIYMWLDAAE